MHHKAMKLTHRLSPPPLSPPPSAPTPATHTLLVCEAALSYLQHTCATPQLGKQILLESKSHVGGVVYLSSWAVALMHAFAGM